jgi:hypothetical protein
MERAGIARGTRAAGHHMGGTLMTDRKTGARWEGELRSGRGTIRLGSGAFEAKYC